jgi:hypothetical protein
MAKADIAAGRAFVSLYIKGTAFTKGLAKAQKELQSFGSSIAGIGASVAGMGAAITGSLTGAVLHFASVGDALDKMSLRTGVSSTALAELGFAAEQSGASMETVESALQRMQKNLGGIGPESIKTTAALEALGLSVDEIQGLSPEDQFQLIAERIGAIEDPTQKAAAAMAVFGQGGRELLPMLSSIRELREEARDLGIAPSPEQVAAAAQITDAINRVRRVIGAAIFEIGSSIAPMVADVLSGFLQVVSGVRKFITENRNLIIVAAKVGAVLTVVGSAIVAIGAGFIGAGLAIGGVLSVVSAMSAALGLASSLLGAIGAGIGLLLSPIGLVIAALVAGGVAWVRFTQTGQTAVRTLVASVTSLFSGLRQTVNDTFGGIVEAIRAGDLSLAGQIAMVGLRLVFMQGLEAITALFGETIGGLVSQITSGDLLGAWRTLGSAMLASWATVVKSIVNVFTTAIRAIDASLDGMLTKFSKLAAIVKDGDGGIIKAALVSIIPPKKKDDPLNAALDSIDEMAQFATDATDAAVQDTVGGTAAATSQAVKDLQAELAELRKQAAVKIEAGRIGEPEEDEVDEPESGKPQSPSMGERSSVATNNLAALASMASSPQDRQAKLLDAANKKADEQLKKMDEQIAATNRLGLFHA